MPRPDGRLTGMEVLAMVIVCSVLFAGTLATAYLAVKTVAEWLW